jgi:hypothetical protein
LEAGCRSKFFLARSTQLGVALATGVDTSRRWAPPVVTVAVTVSYATSVAMVVEVVSTVVILLVGILNTQLCADPRE